MDTLVKVKLDELTVGEFNSQYKTFQTAIVVQGSRRTGFVSEKKIEEIKQAHANGQLIELVFYTNGTYENFKLPTKTDKLEIELEKIKAFLKAKFPEDFKSQQPITAEIKQDAQIGEVITQALDPEEGKFNEPRGEHAGNDLDSLPF